MNSSLLDRPLQRQNLLAKLVHEMDNRPGFGDEFNDDPDSEIQMWLSRVQALMRSVGTTEGVNFAMNASSSGKSWVSGIKRAQSHVWDAIEALKLEFDLNPEANFGEVYNAGESYTYFQDLTKIVSGASSEVFVIDRYFDAKIFAALFPASTCVPIKILCKKYFTAVQDTSEKLFEQAGVSCEVRASNELHDRLVIIDRDQCWLAGGSLKDGGKTTTYIIRLLPNLAPKKLDIYERIWLDSGT